MDFGERLKALRIDRDWTQPAAAAAIGVEQSYLSKLENNHSIPSSDVFERILEAYDLSVDELLDAVDTVGRGQLRSVPEPAAVLRRRELTDALRGQRRQWTMTLCVAFGAALIYAGFGALFFPTESYFYRSDGVILPGESKDYFVNATDLADSHEERRAIQTSLVSRLDEEFLTLKTYRGDQFNLPIDGGSRTFYLTREHKTDAWQNKLITAIGVFAITLGILGLLLSSIGRRVSFRAALSGGS